MVRLNKTKKWRNNMFVDDALNKMDDVLNEMDDMVITDLAKFQSRKYFRDQLVEGIPREYANKIAMFCDIEISQDAWDRHQDRIKIHLDAMARLAVRLMDACFEEFNCNIDDFCAAFGSDISYSLELT
jgi:DNA modification methylase